MAKQLGLYPPKVDSPLLLPFKSLELHQRQDGMQHTSQQQRMIANHPVALRTEFRVRKNRVPPPRAFQTANTAWHVANLEVGR